MDLAIVFSAAIAIARAFYRIFTMLENKLGYKQYTNNPKQQIDKIEKQSSEKKLKKLSLDQDRQSKKIVSNLKIVNDKSNILERQDNKDSILKQNALIQNALQCERQRYESQISKLKYEIIQLKRAEQQRIVKIEDLLHNKQLRLQDYSLELGYTKEEAENIQLQKRKLQDKLANQQNFYENKIQNLKQQQLNLKDSYDRQIERLKNQIKTGNKNTQQIKQNKSEVTIQIELQQRKQHQKLLQNEINELTYRLQQMEKNKQIIEQQNLLTPNQRYIEQLNSEICSKEQLLSIEKNKTIDLNKKVKELQSELVKYRCQLDSIILNNRRAQEKIQSYKINENEDIRCHPQYIALLNKYEQAQKVSHQHQKNSQQAPLSQNGSFIRSINRKPSPIYQSPIQNSKLSPSLSDSKSNQYMKYNTQRPISTIFYNQISNQKINKSNRTKSPIQRPQSTILMEENILNLGQTNFLSGDHRQFLISEINRIKKISVKKTKLLYRSLSQNIKPFYDSISNVPNLLVVLQLKNKKILGAFTQAAFNQDLNKPMRQTKSSSQKAMIIDISAKKTFVCLSNVDTIRYDPNLLIWGKNEFVIGPEQPLRSEFGCEGGVYDSAGYSLKELIEEQGHFAQVNQFEVYRIYMG